MIFSAVFVCFSVLAACGEGMTDLDLVNQQEIDVAHINSIDVLYHADSIMLFSGDADRIIIKEYMSRDNSDYYATVATAGNKLTVESGRRPWGLMIMFRTRIEVYLPASYPHPITVKTSSGSIKADDDYACSNLHLECSSGSISVNAITAESISLRTSSGSIHGQRLTGNLDLRTSSGSIAVEHIEGDVSAEASSGSITFEQAEGRVAAKTSGGRIRVDALAGALTAQASSGSIHCGISALTGDLSLTASSGSVNLELARTAAFNFSARTSSGGLSTPFPDRLSSPVTDRRLVQGVIGSDRDPPYEINIRTTAGAIRVNWLD
jgi:hypothetical protein